AALRRARAAAADPEARPAAAHVGDHLVGAGVAALEREVGYRPPLRLRAQLILQRHPLPLYLGLCGLFVAAGLVGVFAYAARHGAGAVLLAVAGVVALPILVDVGTFMARSLVAGRFPPRVLPKMALPDGIPDEYRTLVVVPTLLRSPEDARRQVVRLERLAAENPDPNLRFALVSDFTDAPAQALPEDREILVAAGAAVAELNGRHADALGDRFFVLHRERVWSPDERCWMGWMRKPGKIEELNRLIREPAAGTGFRWVFGAFERVAATARFRYAVMLDESDWFGPGCIADMVRTAAHPLNRPRFDARLGRVVEGHGILQPLAVPLAPPVRTRYFDVITGAYARRRSEREPAPGGAPRYARHFYHDVFGEGQCHGRAIYDIDAFRSAMEGMTTPSAVPSHDVLESYPLRAGNLSDILMDEDVSARYAVETAIYHRWGRGNWQLLPWVLPRVRDARGRWRRNPVPPASRLRLLTIANMPLVRISAPVLLVLGLTVLPGSAAVWVLLALGHRSLHLAVIGGRVLAELLRWAVLLPPFRSAAGAAALRSRRDELVAVVLGCALAVTTLAHRAALAVDSIGRALWRMLRRTRRTEWVTHGQSKGAAGNLAGYLRRMWISPVAGAATALLVAAASPARLPVAVPLVLLWMAAPWILWYLDQAVPAAGVEPGPKRVPQPAG
ncbi:MAG TPA: hypothetical protein VGR37_04130, partial [Longimicrobiaceae bacterium]|nr:hypothetical protein [Longimicrobiaceae bacterium]